MRCSLPGVFARSYGLPGEEVKIRAGEMGYPGRVFALQADILFGFVQKSGGLTKLLKDGSLM
jgi:hypothetical protein